VRTIFYRWKAITAVGKYYDRCVIPGFSYENWENDVDNRTIDNLSPDMKRQLSSSRMVHGRRWPGWDSGVRRGAEGYKLFRVYDNDGDKDRMLRSV
jgi:hypothetical protein